MTGPEVARKLTPSSRDDDLRQRGLAEARRADEQHVIERFVARPRRLDEHREIGARLLLADEFGQPLRPQRRLGDVLFAAFGVTRRRGGVLTAQVPRSRLYLFGRSSPIPTDFGPFGPGTMTRALRS